MDASDGLFSKPMLKDSDPGGYSPIRLDTEVVVTSSFVNICRVSKKTIIETPSLGFLKGGT